MNEKICTGKGERLGVGFERLKIHFGLKKEVGQMMRGEDVTVRIREGSQGEDEKKGLKPLCALCIHLGRHVIH